MENPNKMAANKKMMISGRPMVSLMESRTDNVFITVQSKVCDRDKRRSSRDVEPF